MNVNRIDLSGRSAIVTGGASGLGFGVAERFLRSGARVVLWDLASPALESARDNLAARGRVQAVGVNVVNEGAVQAAAASAGAVDILVNSAGINRPPTP